MTRDKGSFRIYQVKRAGSGEDWRKDTEIARVDNFPWAGQGAFDYRPLTSARFGTDGQAVFVYMETSETDLRAETRGFGHVHTDSCMEFFFAPEAPAKPGTSFRYLNFEFNPAGAMYLSIGTSRFDREMLALENYRDLFQVKTEVSSSGWNLEYRIPGEWLKPFFPSFKMEPGTTWRGNFYKCGDHTSRPHFGCWSPIDLPKPDFHCPDFFGTLTFV